MLPYSSYQNWNEAMQLIYALVNNFFGDNVRLVNAWGPVQMCVFHLEFEHLSKEFNIIFACERGALESYVKKGTEKCYIPRTIYGHENRMRFESKKKDVYEGVLLMYIAIRQNRFDFSVVDSELLEK